MDIMKLIIFSVFFYYANGFLWSETQPKTKDPELTMTMEEIIQRWGFPVEKHTVKTTDGYLLTVFRIPYGRRETRIPTKPRPVVLFMHGLEASSIIFISNLPSQDAAYLYADNGFDVWIGNFRGNTYSLAHEKYSSSEDIFWHFSWDDMAQYDIPAIVDYIMQNTRSNFIYYVGHSMGTTTAFALLSSNQDYSKKIRRVYALAPVTTLKNSRGSARNMLTLIGVTDGTLSGLGIESSVFLSNNLMASNLLQFSCGPDSAESICLDILTVSQGDSNQINKTRIPVFMAHLPAGTSWRTLAQYGQTIQTGNFQKYDMGTAVKNHQLYGRDTPPTYDLTLIQTPIALYSGDKDVLSVPEDVTAIKSKLKNVITNVSLRNYNHADFLWGTRASVDVFIPIMRDIQSDFNQTVHS